MWIIVSAISVAVLLIIWRVSVKLDRKHHRRRLAAVQQRMAALEDAQAGAKPAGQPGSREDAA